jgi:putative endonuclease
MPYVYVLRCGDGSLYTGIAKDVDRRLEQHRAGQASRYTRSHLPVTLVWMRQVRSWSLALREERRIKAMRKLEKEELVKVEVKVSRSPAKPSPPQPSSPKGRGGRKARKILFPLSPFGREGLGE